MASSVEIDGQTYQPVPDSWLEHGRDDRDGDGPALLAVSTAPWRQSLRVRYAHPSARAVGQLIEPAVDGADGLIPRRLAAGSWPRSIPAARLEPVGEIRLAEIDWLRDLWIESDRAPESVEIVHEHRQRARADGGTTNRGPGSL